MPTALPCIKSAANNSGICSSLLTFQIFVARTCLPEFRKTGHFASQRALLIGANSSANRDQDFVTGDTTLTRISSAGRQPVVLLGASNLTMGWQPLLRALVSRIRRPVDVFAAMGMGRSYVDWSTFGIRQLPGIVDSGIWDSLRQQHPQPATPPLVMLTDIGNDLVYGRSPEMIMDAIRLCLQQLKTWSGDCQILFTGLPMESVASLSRFRFLVARTLLFPASPLSWSDIKRKVAELNQLVEAEVRTQQLKLARPRGEWYGLDPIHVLSRYRETAFGFYFDHWGHPTDFKADNSFDQAATATVTSHHQSNTQLTTDMSAITWSLPTAERQKRWGRNSTTQQPSVNNDRLRVFAF